MSTDSFRLRPRQDQGANKAGAAPRLRHGAVGFAPRQEGH